MSLAEIINAKLPLSVHDYMQLCLQHPQYGYYRQAKAIGKEGDFTTAPEISQIFGDMIGFWLCDISQRLGDLDFYLVECGPGRGTLSADLLRHIMPSGLHLVESNQTLREMQKKTLWKAQPKWHDNLSTLPTDKPLLIIANEFFDAFPIQQWVGEEERLVSSDWKFMPEGDVTRETCPQAEAILKEICERLKKQGGVFLTIDYGYSEGEQRDTLQAMKNHRYHDPLQDPGEADLTAHVDFDALSAVAKEAGCSVSPVITQEKFLRSLGGEIWLQKLLMKTTDPTAQKTLQTGWLRLISPAQMGSLFKVMAVTAHQDLKMNGFM